MSPFLAASKVYEWCENTSTWPNMFELYEELAGARVRPPTTPDIEESIIPRLRRAFEEGELLVVESPLFEQTTKSAEEGVHGQPTKLEPPAPPPVSRRPVSPPKTLFSFAIRFVDELGTAISDVELAFSHGGAKDDGTTDGNGVARIEDSPVRTATAKVVDSKALRKALKPRWDQARGDRKWLDESQGVTVVRLMGDKLSSFDLVADKLRIVSVQPYLARARLIGGFFDTSKTFVLPSGLDGIRGLVRMYGEFPRSKMLVVGHTDTAGKPSYNDPLSLERAEALKDYLTDSVDGWLKWYATSVSDGKRWGAIEDRSMIASLPDASSREKTESPVRWFQRTRGLTVDGKAGPETRQALVKEYMALDGTSLPRGIELIAHGCGENFPRDATGEDVEDPDNRRTEVYFFDEILGIQPPPPGKNCAKGSVEYPEWVRRSQRTDDFAGPEDDLLTIGRLLSVASSDKSFAKPSTIPLLKEVSRRLSTNPVLQVVVLGNSEDTGNGDANKKLARARALTVRAWLLQDKKFFRTQFDSPEGGSKWGFEEVQWMLSAIEVDGDPCYAGYVDGYRGDATLSAIETFQIANEVAPTRAMDEATLALLIEQYLAILGDTVPDPDQVAFAVGGGGLVPRTSGKETKPIEAEEWKDPHFEGFRRTELFLWNQTLQPAPETLNQASGASHPSYETWCKTAERELLTPQTLTAVVQVVDRLGRPVSTTGTVFRTSDDGSEEPAASFGTSSRGIATLNLNPGVYTVVVGGNGRDATMAGLHVRIDEVGGMTIRLKEGAPV